MLRTVNIGPIASYGPGITARDTMPTDLFLARSPVLFPKVTIIHLVLLSYFKTDLSKCEISKTVRSYSPWQPVLKIRLSLQNTITVSAAVEVSKKSSYHSSGSSSFTGIARGFSCLSDIIVKSSRYKEGKWKDSERFGWRRRKLEFYLIASFD